MSDEPISDDDKGQKVRKSGYTIYGHEQKHVTNLRDQVYKHFKDVNSEGKVFNGNGNTGCSKTAYANLKNDYEDATKDWLVAANTAVMGHGGVGQPDDGEPVEPEGDLKKLKGKNLPKRYLIKI